jgi:uncharacterized repeat protein (TIGR03803 family)
MRAIKRVASVALAGALGLTGCSLSFDRPGTGAVVATRQPHPPVRSDKNRFRLIYAFEPDPQPRSALTYLDGTFYGTTSNGGGTIYAVTPGGTEEVIHSFDFYDGIAPTARLISVNGVLYGTASAGGADGDGTVFSVTPSGSFTLLHSFDGADGSQPRAGLTNVKGTLYGTTQSGGAYGQGTVFRITLSGSESVVHNFGNAYDGAIPDADLLYSHGILYGTTFEGGSAGKGTVFSVTPSGSEQILHSFGTYGSSPDGQFPFSTLLMTHGVLYGTTSAGGSNSCSNQGCGTVFSLTLDGTERILHNFNPSGDGFAPIAGLIETGGTFYGTTSAGGLLGSGISYGTVYSITPGGKESILWSFENAGDGSDLVAPLTFLNGKLYGTAPECGEYCGGSVFAIKR